MKTYQDLEKQTSERDRIEFIRSAIAEHKGSEMYKTAFNAEEYDRQRNVTIMTYAKVLYTLSGRAVRDIYTPNHKLCSNYFNRFTTQENQYLLGNGVKLLNEDSKEKLGKKFDKKLQRMGRNALVQGVSFGFWNLDHLETFKLTEFVPLYDEENSALRAGIRFYQISADKPLRCTLYELDGYTDYIQRKNEDMKLLQKKRPYQAIIQTSVADGSEIVAGENYEGFPVIPMWGNLHHQSELVGFRENIDAYDLIKSGFSNDMDEAHLYWALKNAGGMDDVDIAKFLERLNILHVAQVEDEADIQPHEVPIPYESRVAYLDRLEQDMYNDYQALNVADISGGQKTATEIRAAYQPLDNKVDQFEYCVVEFLDELFALIGLDDTPSFTRDKVATMNEDLQSLMLAAEYLDDVYITHKACAILGDPDAADGILERRAEMDVSRFLGGVDEQDSA